jgi:hypothetical protein
MAVGQLWRRDVFWPRRPVATMWGRGRSVARDGTVVIEEASKLPHDVELAQDGLTLVQGMARCFAFEPSWRYAWRPS